MEVTAPTLTGRWVRLEPLAEEHREGLRAASDDDRVWQFMYFDGRGPMFDKPFNDALTQRAEGKRLPYAVRLSRFARHLIRQNIGKRHSVCSEKAFRSRYFPEKYPRRRLLPPN